MTNSIRTLLVTVAIVGLATATGWAHAVVFPKQSPPGAYEKYVLRVPNERESATTRIEIRFPASLRVNAFADVPGFTLEILTDSAGRFTGAAWTGNLAVDRFIEFPFSALNPKTNETLEWPVYQTYADGVKIEWTGKPGSERPASVTEIVAASDYGSRAGWASLVVSTLALAMSLRKRTPKPRR